MSVLHYAKHDAQRLSIMYTKITYVQRNYIYDDSSDTGHDRSPTPTLDYSSDSRKTFPGCQSREILHHNIIGFKTRCN